MRSFPALAASGILLAASLLALSGCGVVVLYKVPTSTYSGRPVPPSGLLQRVMAAYTANGTTGGLEILDGLRDLRGNLQNTTLQWKISGYSEANPVNIINFPEETTGYALAYNDGNLTEINYSKESSVGVVLNAGASTPSAAAAPLGTMFAGADEQAGLLIRHHFDSDKAVYELNSGGHHDHLVCIQCGRVEEFFDEEIERRQKKVAAQRGFAIHDHSLHIYADCTKNACPHKPK